MRYLDTSVLVALYLPEPMNSKVQKLCSGSDLIAISGLSEVEFHSALARRIRTNELTKGDALKVLSQFKVHADARATDVCRPRHPSGSCCRPGRPPEA